MPVKIREVHLQERQAVYRFRYRVYVEEMSRPQIYADHHRKLIIEPLDTTGHILAAYDSQDEVVGTVRFNVGIDEQFGIYTELYRLESFGPFFPAKISITTKLMVSANYRHGRLAIKLAKRCYERGLELGTCFDCIDCNAHLVPFFKYLGYRQLWPEVDHPEYGRVVPLVLAMNDVRYLTRIGSPLAEVAFCNHAESVDFFRDVLQPQSQAATVLA